jgi:hypothetical protein
MSVPYRALLPAVAAFSMLAAAGCSRSGPAPPETAGRTVATVWPTERAGRGQPGDLSPVAARLRVGTVRLGAELDASGDVAAPAAGDAFLPGDPIFAALGLEAVGEGSALAATWIGPGETKLHEETATVPRGVRHLAFRAPDTTGWTPGEYRVEIRLGDEIGGRARFEIRALPAGG